MRILFVCLGNICRSPMAEGIMKQLITDHQLEWEVDSAGTESYHVGEKPDPRAIRTCRKHGIEITGQRARRISKNDFETFDKIYALAGDVLQEINRMHPNLKPHGELKLLLDELFPGEHRSVPDPYYGREEDFEPVFRSIMEACEAIVKKYQ